MPKAPLLGNANEVDQAFFANQSALPLGHWLFNPTFRSLCHIIPQGSEINLPPHMNNNKRFYLIIFKYKNIQTSAGVSTYWWNLFPPTPMNHWFNAVFGFNLVFKHRRPYFWNWSAITNQCLISKDHNKRPQMFVVVADW